MRALLPVVVSCLAAVLDAQVQGPVERVQTPPAFAAEQAWPLLLLVGDVDTAVGDAVAQAGFVVVTVAAREPQALAAVPTALRQRYRVDQVGMHLGGDTAALRLALARPTELQTLTLWHCALPADAPPLTRLRGRRVRLAEGAHELLAPLGAAGIDVQSIQTKPEPAALAAHFAALHAERGLPGAAGEVARTLDDFHTAAAQGDAARYFAILPDDAVFLGTDASERWTGAEFRAFAIPYFERGPAWTYVPLRRHVTLADDGASAWFDEVLDNEAYGECRGSGVLQRRGDAWVLRQYDLTIPVPNELAREFVARIRAATDDQVEAVPKPAHDRAFWGAWQAFHAPAPPADELPALLAELSALLASPDPRLRDDIAYSLLAKWLMTEPIVPVAERRRLLDEWLGVVASPAASTVHRSFGALGLGLLVAADNRDAWLSDEEFAQTLAAGIGFLRRETDARGLDPVLGWVHCTAHGADLLKSCARSTHLTAAGKAAIWTAVVDELASATVAWGFGEDDRLARVWLALVRRDDFDAEALPQWLERAWPAPGDAAPTPVSVQREQNRQHFTSALLTLLTLTADEGPRLARARPRARPPAAAPALIVTNCTTTPSSPACRAPSRAASAPGPRAAAARRTAVP